MNTKDLKIISQLRTDARMPLTNMSRITGIPVSTIFDRLKFHEGGFIVKHTTLLDFTKLGYNTVVNITLKVDRDSKELLKEFLSKHECVNSLYKINNGFDFMLECIFRQIIDMEKFLEDLDKRFKILEKRFFFIIEPLKKEAFMSNINLLPAE
jgi:DNA-binding Lrp family transcriptional regulator